MPTITDLQQTLNELNNNRSADNNEGADPSNHLANEGQIIVIEDARGAELPIEWKAFLTAFEDKYESNWNETEVYARMDPIYTFQNTKRTISLGFTVPSYGPKEAALNIQKSARLSRLLYPSYDINEGVSTISGAPIFKIQFANLISDPNGGGPLYGIIKSYSFKPKLEAGFYTRAAETGVSKTLIVPKDLGVSFDFNVLHAHPLGYNSSTKKFRTEDPNSYPYGISALTKQAYEIAYAETLAQEDDGPADIQEAQSTSMFDPVSGEPIEGSGW